MDCNTFFSIFGTSNTSTRNGVSDALFIAKIMYWTQIDQNNSPELLSLLFKHMFHKNDQQNNQESPKLWLPVFAERWGISNIVELRFSTFPGWPNGFTSTSDIQNLLFCPGPPQLANKTRKNERALIGQNIMRRLCVVLVFLWFALVFIWLL